MSEHLTVSEAIELLEIAPKSSDPSRVNSALTEWQAVLVIRNCLKTMAPNAILNDLTEKRIWQVVKNQKRPKYY